MNIAVFRQVCTGSSGLKHANYSSVNFGKPWDVAARYAKAEDHAESYRRGEDL